METQRRIILFHLLAHNTITSWQAITLYGITRLACYINILRKEGKLITDEWEKKDGKQWKKYTLTIGGTYGCLRSPAV